MRGVIPNASAYLHGVIQRLDKANQSLNQQASSVPHEQLDEIYDPRLRSFEPQAPVHSALNGEPLKAEMNKITGSRVVAIESCPAVQELEVEYQESVELMMAGRKPKVSMRRPALNIEDL
ncbi:hypothetical protein FRC04_009299 [Tulasnella sp. 424]|nr:hypothetical protein FRC04_009299 [Tulasnella sp. 424]KAG8973117.1 hypothetical protein FRC05_009127 [Tulasnella sp. 425]